MDKKLKPSDFMSVMPWDSVRQNAQDEALACSIMATRNFKGNKWSGNGNEELNYKDYCDYKESLGNFSTGVTPERFYEVAKYCKFPDTAALFSKEWEKVVNNN